MASFFKNIANSIGNLADKINGSDPEEATLDDVARPVSHQSSAPVPPSQQEPEAKAEPVIEPKSETKVNPQHAPKSNTSDFNNAIDRRDRAVRLLVSEFKEVTGSHSDNISRLYVYVIVDREDYDVKKYAWADKEFRSQLRFALDSALLDGVGSRTLEVRLITREYLPASAREIVPEELYYSFAAAPVRSSRVRGRLSVIEGTGSMVRAEYILDSDEKQIYHLGRGPLARKPGAIRPNDIVINDADADASIQARNNHVSSAHCDILASGGHFYLKALRWGCRPLGGSPTKLIYDGREHEVCDDKMSHRLADGYMIELGKNVILLFNEL